MQDLINKIHNADCLEFMKQLPDKSIDCVITDVPYLMQNGQKGQTDLGKRLQKRRDDLMDKDLISFKESDIIKLTDELKRIQNKINLFVFCSKDQIRSFYNCYPEINPYILFWGKTNPAPTFKNSLLPNVEYILWFREKGVQVYSTYENSSRYDITPINSKDKKLFNHPTVKPVEIISRYISFATKENDLILDPFAGSGTTAIACLNTKRNFICIEKDKGYYETSVQRLENYNKQLKLF